MDKMEVSDSMLRFGKKKSKDNKVISMQTVDELDAKEGVETEPEALETPKTKGEVIEFPKPTEPEMSEMPEIKARIEIPTYGILVSEGGLTSLHTVEDVSDNERYESLLSEMYQIDKESDGVAVYSLRDQENMTSLESVKYLHFTMAHSPLTGDFKTDTMLRRSALLDAHFANVDPILGEGMYHASIVETKQSNYVSHFDYHLMFNSELDDESFDTMLSLFYSTLEIHGYIIMDLDTDLDDIEDIEFDSDINLDIDE